MGIKIIISIYMIATTIITVKMFDLHRPVLKHYHGQKLIKEILSFGFRCLVWPIWWIIK